MPCKKYKPNYKKPNYKKSEYDWDWDWNKTEKPIKEALSKAKNYSKKTKKLVDEVK